MKTRMIASVMLSTLLFSGSTWAVCNANVVITRPDARYADHGNGTVTDKQTSLVWMQCSQGRSGATCATGSSTAMNWKQALEAAQTANGGAGTFGYTDWRLPTVAELRTLVEQACYSPSINATLFPQTQSDWYWSASPYAYNSGYAWFVDFGYGGGNGLNKDANYYVRLVRGGQ